MDLYFSLIDTLCSLAPPSCRRDYESVLSISDGCCCLMMSNGNGPCSQTCEYVRRVSKIICVCVCVFSSVFYGLHDGALALCRQPVLILWPPPQLQHVGNKPFFSNLQTVQQSMGNYLSQSMGQPFYFSFSLLLPLSYL